MLTNEDLSCQMMIRKNKEYLSAIAGSRSSRSIHTFQVILLVNIYRETWNSHILDEGEQQGAQRTKIKHTTYAKQEVALECRIRRRNESRSREPIKEEESWQWIAADTRQEYVDTAEADV